MRSRTLLHLAARCATLVGISALLVACDPLAAFAPEIIADDQLFALQAKDVDNTTATVTYTWANPQPQATVHHATTTFGSGSASIRILDATGTLVYSSALLSEITQTTAKGVAGSWTIVVTMTGYSGTLGFHVLAGP